MKLSKIHNYLKDIGDDTNFNKEQQIDTKLIKEASHAKVDKFALFLCALFDLHCIPGSHPENWKLKYKFKGTQDALTRLIKFLAVAVWGNKTKSEVSRYIKNWIKPTKDSNVFYIDNFQFGTTLQMIDEMEKNLFIEPRNMKRAIDKIVG